MAAKFKFPVFHRSSHATGAVGSHEGGSPRRNSWVLMYVLHVPNALHLTLIRCPRDGQPNPCAFRSGAPGCITCRGILHGREVEVWRFSPKLPCVPGSVEPHERLSSWADFVSSWADFVGPNVCFAVRSALRLPPHATPRGPISNAPRDSLDPAPAADQRALSVSSAPARMEGAHQRRSHSDVRQVVQARAAADEARLQVGRLKGRAPAEDRLAMHSADLVPTAKLEPEAPGRR
jgi:hypothetical protein